MKKLIGKIISDKMNRTKVIEITEIRRHPIYEKSYQVSKKVLADDEKSEFKVDDIVEIISVKPISKRKVWKIQRKVK